MSGCLLSLVLLLADAGSGQQSQPAKAEDYLRSGKEHLEKGNLDRALTDFTEVIRLAPRGPEGYYQRGVVYRKKGMVDAAIADLTKAVELKQTQIALGFNIDRGHAELAAAYRSKGEHDLALPLEISAVRRSGPLSLAGNYLTLRKVEKAEPLLLKYLPEVETEYGKRHPGLMEPLNMLGVVYRETGRYRQAEAVLERSVALGEAHPKQNDSAFARAIFLLASVRARQNQLESAERLCQRSIAIYESLPPEMVRQMIRTERLQVAASIATLAGLQMAQRRYEEAEATYLKSVARCEAILNEIKLASGLFSDHLTAILNDLGCLYHLTGKFDKAEATFRRALELARQVVGPRSDDGDRVLLHNHARLALSAGRPKEALATADLARRKARGYAARILPTLPEVEQLDFLQHVDRDRFHFWLSFALRYRDDATVAAHSATWALNGKGLVHQTLAEQARLGRDANDPKLAAIAGRLRTVRQQLAAQALDSGARPQDRSRLANEEQELSRQLSQARQEQIGSNADHWLELSGVRRALPKDAVLVHLARLRSADLQDRAPEPEWKGAGYAAWVIPPDGTGEVKLIDLGDAERIDQAVQAVRRAMQDAQGTPGRPGTIRTAGEAEAERAMRKPLEVLAGLVLAPLVEHIGTTGQWIISPDSALWLAPWAALPLKDGRYAIKKHTIRYLTSARDLFAQAAEKPGRSAIMADPDFDLGLEAARTEVRRLGIERETTSELRGGAPTRLPLVPRLPGTAAEARQVKPRLKRLVGDEPQVFLDKQALEAVFHSLRRPRVLLLSTHGFFLENRAGSATQEPDSGSPVRMKDGRRLDNPLLRCGLTLAGCNNRDHGAVSDDDGILTGLEIVGADLRGTELVVLSACETGLGEVRDGEGVAGLRQAFQLAGADAVVATLWQVPDLQTAQLMVHLFDQLATQRPKADALREAQLAMIQARRLRTGAAHPFFWASFTLTGR